MGCTYERKHLAGTDCVGCTCDRKQFRRIIVFLALLYVFPYLSARRSHTTSFCRMCVPGGCRITGSGKTIKVQTLGCAPRSPPTDPRPNFAKISWANSMNSQHKGHKIYTGSGHFAGVIPYSSVVVMDCLLG